MRPTSWHDRLPPDLRSAIRPGGEFGPEQVIVLDMHTAGEPVRIALAGYPDLPGATILAKRRAAQEVDDLRRRMNREPRGHAGMYGVLPVTPSVADADAAVLFTHASGYSTATRRSRSGV